MANEQQKQVVVVASTKSVWIQVSASIALVVLAGCSKNLDVATAKPFIDEWIQQKTRDVVIGEQTPRECRQELFNKGYIKAIRHDQFHDGTSIYETYEATEKLPADKGKVSFGGLVLPLFKAQLVTVSSVQQIEGEKLAKVRFSYQYVPINSDVPNSCRMSDVGRWNEHESVPADVQTVYAAYELTTNGWVVFNFHEPL